MPRRGFTLIELLTVIAIIGILSAIVIPTTAAVRTSAKRAKTKVMFGQWASAMELFRQEYGFYPAIDDGRGKIDPVKFAGALTGRTLDGSALAAGAALAGNTRLISFYTIAEGDLGETRTTLADAFGNDDIAILWDRNGDGRITALDGAGCAVSARDTGLSFQPTDEEIGLAFGVRAGVIFYSAGQGERATDVVFSWK